MGIRSWPHRMNHSTRILFHWDSSTRDRISSKKNNKETGFIVLPLEAGRDRSRQINLLRRINRCCKNFSRRSLGIVLMVRARSGPIMDCQAIQADNSRCRVRRTPRRVNSTSSCIYDNMKRYPSLIRVVMSARCTRN